MRIILDPKRFQIINVGFGFYFLSNDLDRAHFGVILELLLDVADVSI